MLEFYINFYKDETRIVLNLEKTKTINAIKEIEDSPRVDKTLKMKNFSMGIDKKNNPLYFFIREAQQYNLFKDIDKGVTISKLEEIIDFVNESLLKMGTKQKYQFKMEDKFVVFYDFMN